jgi:crossover junction endodeoxyribonuclease RuvC
MAESNSSKRLILGIDPGLNFTGYGLIQVTGRRLQTVEFGVIRSRREDDFFDKLHRIFDQMSDIARQFQPDEVAVENLFVSRNSTSALRLGHARAAAIVAVLNQNIDVSEYTPREVKKALTGNGAADKKQVQYMVQKLLALPEPPLPLDASDALAVAITHYQRASISSIK